MRSTGRIGFGFLLLALGVVACGGSRLSTPGQAVGASEPLTLHVRLPASFAGSSLAASLYRDGALPPAAPTETIALDSAACTVSGTERLCTLSALAPAGLVDVGLRAAGGAGGAVLAGTALRLLSAPGGSTFSLAFDGQAARWGFSPQTLAAAADGEPHQVPFAVAARDVEGFTLIGAAPRPPSSVTVSGDLLHQVALVAQGAGSFTADYGGLAVGNVSLSATAPGASTATVPFSSLAAAPALLELDPGKTGTVTVSLPHYQGPFEAFSTGPNCSVSPRSLTPGVAGGAVTFTVRLNAAPGCELKVSATQPQVPIVIPVKNGIAKPGISIGPSKIKHVVVLLQENRSFDNIFGGRDGKGKPFPGADTVSNPDSGEPTPHNHLGQPVAMSTGLLEECYDPYHAHGNSVTDVDGGKMNGFDEEGVVQENCAPTPAPTNYVYRTIEYNEVSPYWLMGEQYAISDRMFEPFSSASYGPHLYAVSGQSENTIDNPDAGLWGCDNVSDGLVTVITDLNGGQTGGVPPCFIAPTLGDEMDQRGVSWRYYGASKSDFGYDWMAYDSFNDIRNGPDWNSKVIQTPAQIVTDVEAGTLASMTWVTPLNANSDHPQAHSNTGPAWITSIVNAIGQSSFWDSTAIFITWDDWGGWYDHVPPPVTGPVSLGIRVPVIIVSPYAKNGYVSHVVHTTGSILHFAEEVFDLPSLGEDDAREDDFQDAFNYAQTPTPFSPFAQTKKSKQDLIRASARTGEPPEDDKVGD